MFLDGVKKEFEEIKAIPVQRTRQRKLTEFQKKLSSSYYLDPACGSGNFLTETYLSLRRLENEILRILFGGQIEFGFLEHNPIQVSISQFYGIEINDFAVTVAKTALWIAESQMLKETEDIVRMNLEFLPLKTNANIIEGNALRPDWEKVVPKEKLFRIVGNIPFDDKEVSEAYKLNALKLLNEKYGMTEKDFVRAEIEMVPAMKASDIGLDRSMVGGYGQDDRVCAYTAVMAAFEVTEPEYTTVTACVDKEEIGSEGNTGMASDNLHHFIEDLCDIFGTKTRMVYRNSLCLSSDVNAAFDPSFPDVFEANNSSFLGHGPVLSKYTGSRGKSGSNDASAETMYKVTSCMEREGVIWQIGELGKVDEGGGGTIALFMGDHDVDTVDLGVPVLAMHAPYEITSKLDIYHTYKAFCAFYR